MNAETYTVTDISDLLQEYSSIHAEEVLKMYKEICRNMHHVCRNMHHVCRKMQEYTVSFDPCTHISSEGLESLCNATH